MNENFSILIQISQKYVLKGPIYYPSANIGILRWLNLFDNLSWFLY